MDNGCARTVTRGGFLWPAADEIAYGDIMGGLRFLMDAISRRKSIGLAIQAGGNCGIYPLALSGAFDKVITCEPDGALFPILLENLVRQDCSNVIAVNAALGDSQGECGLIRWDRNCGCTRTDKTVKDGVIITTIDQLVYDEKLPVGFIQLDIEGDEIAAIRGAEKTIRRYRPLIMVEDRGHTGSKGQTEQYLRSMGYAFVDRSETDVLMEWGGK